MSTKVSVVIPVYNPGKYIDPCIDSLVRQTLPADEFEVLFVNDGSTDDTAERLDNLAKEHPHFRVIHIPNSGWPGKPRNIGVGEAKGEYVQFVDQDDYLASDALRRLYDMGHRNGSDIVIGKVASNFRGVPHGVFKKDREKCSLKDAPLYDSLTPHKMFRTEFLRENKIAYPEGKRRLEDQLYMMQAYFPAKVVSILGTYTCYYYSRRDDGQNAGSAKIVPSGYYGNLREVLDVVVANTEPGDFRDQLLRRFFRVEMLGRLSEPAVVKYDAEYLDEMVQAVRPLAEDFMGEGVIKGLGPLLRLRARLLEANDQQGLVRLARLAASIKAAARLEDFDWEPDGRIRVKVTGQLVYGDDQKPLTLLRRDDRLYVHPEVTSGVVDDDSLVDVTDDLDSFKAEMSLRNRETAVEWSCPATFTTELDELGDGVCRVLLRGTGHLSSEGGPGRGRVSRGFWDVWVPLRGLGVVRKARLGADRAEHVDAKCLPALLSSPARPVIPYFTEPHGNLTLDVARRAKKMATYLEGRPVLRVAAGQTELRLEVFTTGKSAAGKAALVLNEPATGDEAAQETAGAAKVVHSVPAAIRPVKARAHLTVPQRMPGAPAGQWQLSARLDGDKGPLTPLCGVSVDAGGRLRLDDSLPQADAALTRELATLRRGRRLRRLLGVARPIVRRLPPSARKKVRRLAARLTG
ncbi:glycosyltransferase family 2 protein [Streptomyces sp. NPDC006274]|uniref:glycosyltransferase family 2 protein n=1 Tax=unclassified Streptomyces TaxID=2593676 RepID=UPI0033ABB8A2